jgi:hypothetical protein
LLAIVDSEMLIKMNRDMRSVALAEGIGSNEQDRLLFKSNQSDIGSIDHKPPLFTSV